MSVNHSGVEIKIKNHRELGYFSAQLFRIRDGARKTMPCRFPSYEKALNGAREEAERFATSAGAKPSRSAPAGA